jgi:hypothetical protein
MYNTWRLKMEITILALLMAIPLVGLINLPLMVDDDTELSPVPHKDQ